MTDAQILAQIPYFHALTPAERESLATRCRPRTFQPGDVIFSEGEAADGLWVVTGGRVKIYRVSPRGREQVLHTERPGATLGEVPLFDGGGYVASAAALEPSRLLLLPRAHLETLCRQRSEVALAIIATLARRVRSFARLAEDLAFREIHERLALLLLEEARRSEGVPGRGTEIILSGTREEIAARVGTVRELVSRALGEMARRDLLRAAGRRVTLLDVAGLEALARGEVERPAAVRAARRGSPRGSDRGQRRR